MSSIIFHWDTPKGLDTPHGKKKLLSRWNLTCKSFGVTELLCVTTEKIKMSDAEVSFKTFSSLSDAINYTKYPLVYIEQGGTSLYNFKHPKNATYVFGSDYGELIDNKFISIDSLLPIHAEIAAGIVLSHRYQQWH